MKPVIYVVANKSLGMSPGKLAAQVGHAVAGTFLKSEPAAQAIWHTSSHRWMIVLEASGGEQLYYLGEYLAERKVPHYCVVDEGVNEIAPFSLTAIGVGILDKDSEEAEYLSGLSLYRYALPEDERKRIHTEGWNAAMAYIVAKRTKRWYKRFFL